MDQASAFVQHAITDPFAASLWLSSFAGLLWFLGLAAKLMTYLLVLALGLSMRLIAPRYWSRAGTAMDERTAGSFGVGLLGFALMLGSALVLMVTIIGIPFAFTLMAAYVVLMGVGLAAAGESLGRRLFATMFTESPNAHLVLGILVLMLLSLLPVVGELVTVLALSLGTGALMQAAWAKSSPPMSAPMFAV